MSEVCLFALGSVRCESQVRSGWTTHCIGINAVEVHPPVYQLLDSIPDS